MNDNSKTNARLNDGTQGFHAERIPVRGARNNGFMYVVLASFFYAFQPMLSQLAYAEGMSVNSLMASRYLIGTTLLWLFVLARRKKIRVQKKDFLLLMLVGADVFVCVRCLMSSYRFLPGAVASLLVFLYVVIVNVIRMLSGKDKPTVVRIVSLCMLMFGLFAVVYTPSGSIGFNFTGIIFGLSAGFLYAFWAMGMGAERFANYSAETTMAYMLIVPSVAAVAQCLLSASPVLPASPRQWLFVCLLSLAAGVVAPIAFCTGVKRIGAGTASMINTLEPVFAYFVGMIIMHDKLSWTATAGGIIIVAGLLFLHGAESLKGFFARRSE